MTPNYCCKHRRRLHRKGKKRLYTWITLWALDTDDCLWTKYEKIERGSNKDLKDAIAYFYQSELYSIKSFGWKYKR